MTTMQPPIRLRGARIAIAVLVTCLLAACGGASFSIRGSWKSVGETGWGQAQPGAIVRFGDGEANLYSPRDTYALTRDGDGYRLEVTGLLGGSATFALTVVDDDTIQLRSGGADEPVMVLKRVG